MSLISALTDKPLPAGTVSFGEVGLSGEVRSVSNVMNRIREAEVMGFDTVILPMNNLRKLDVKDMDIKLIGVSNINELKKILK